MTVSNASRSAAIIAAHRAMESSKDPKDRICHDPLAHRLLPPGFTVIGEYDIPEETALKFFKDFVPGFHEFFIARTRYIDDYLHDCLKSDLRQLVFLGAGYDSRAYRIDELKDGIKIFEVDHPDTQQVKQARLREIFHALPDHVTYVPLDFRTGGLGAALYENGYDRRLKTLFIWEGVTMYIDRQNVEETLGFIAANSAEESAVIFDYTLPDVIDGISDRKEGKAWQAKASQSDEPLRFGIGDRDVEQLLHSYGFRDVNCVHSDFFNATYFDGADDAGKATPIFSIAHARVGKA